MLFIIETISLPSSDDSTANECLRLFQGNQFLNKKHCKNIFLCIILYRPSGQAQVLRAKLCGNVPGDPAVDKSSGGLRL